MNRLLVIGLLLSCLWSCSVFGLEYDLPELVGAYNEPFDLRIVVVDLGGAASSITGAYIELSGVISTSWASAAGDTFDWGGTFGAFLGDSDAHIFETWYSVAGVGVSGEFSVAVQFSRMSAASWDFFTDGIGELEFGFSPDLHLGIIDGMGASPAGTIVSARLVLEGAVNTDLRSWSQLKALYR